MVMTWWDSWISIHTALAGCDLAERDYVARIAQFQSTQPSQAVTYMTRYSISPTQFQSTQPSQAVTLIVWHGASGISHFNPHSPRRL